jgi:hypothetical protein
MSAADQAIGTLSAVLDELNDATTAAQAAKTQIDEGLTHAAAAGGAALVAAFQDLRETVDRLCVQIATTVDDADEALTKAKAVSSGA